jgi:hypothetical protein
MYIVFILTHIIQLYNLKQEGKTCLVFIIIKKDICRSVKLLYIKNKKLCKHHGKPHSTLISIFIKLKIKISQDILKIEANSYFFPLINLFLYTFYYIAN